jgi:hypothetical protein
MLRGLIDGAYRLDIWLDQRLGRPYAILLSIGLTTEIIRRIVEFRIDQLTAGHVLDFAWLLLLNLALLVHQLASLHHIRARRAAAKSGAAEPHG